MSIFFTTFHHTAQNKFADGVELQIFISILNAIFKEEKEFLATITRSMQQPQTPKGSFWKGEALEERPGPLTC